MIAWIQGAWRSAWGWCLEELRFLGLWFRTLDAQFARGVIFFGELPPALVLREPYVQNSIPTGSLLLDAALRGGWPRGALVELLGPPGVGKSTFAWESVLACVASGGSACYVDIDRGLARLVGGSDACESILVLEPISGTSGEQVWDMLEALLMSDGVDLVVIDSVNGLIAQEEQETVWGEGFDSWQRARWLGRALYQLQPALHYSRGVVLCVRQTTPDSESPCTERVQGQTLPLLADVRVALQRPLARERVHQKELGLPGLWIFKSPWEREIRQLWNQERMV